MRSRCTLNTTGTLEEKENLIISRRVDRSLKPVEKLFFMEIDGMDQSKTLLPHYINPPKNIDKDLLFNFHITIVKYGKHLFLPFSISIFAYM